MKPTRNERLLVWSLATFHTAFFMAVLIALLYASGRLGALLGGLNTIVGLLLFGALWYTTFECTDRARRSLRWTTLEAPIDLTQLIGLSFVWGGANGVLFFIFLLLIQVAPGFLASLQVAPDALLVLILIGGVGSLFAFVMGGFFGLAFAVIDFTLLEVSRRIFLRVTATTAKRTADS